LKAVLHDTIAISGALFALLVGATTFTLVLRAFGTDVVVAGALAHLAGGAPAALAVVLAALAACALVLDAFEIIFVVVPVLMPPLLMRVPDATWVSVLALLILQASFLAPPFGYAFLMMRSVTRTEATTASFARAIAPYLAAQIVVLAAIVSWPGLLVRR
jgi:TRAP-type mannitol/chloroaromatic compound transport system permease large subunit